MAWLKERWLLILVLGTAAATLVIFRAAAVAYFIEPIALLLWAGWNVLASVHQGVYWTILIAAAVILIIRLVPWSQEAAPAPSYAHKPAPPGRIERWQQLIRKGGAGARQAQELRVALQQLLASVVAATEHPASENLEESLAATHLRLPEEARDFLFPAKGAHSPLAAFWRRLTRREDADLDDLLKWMESELEIHNDQ